VVDVRVGIVSWNTGALLDRCLAALPAALDGLTFEAVVVDNDSSDSSADIAATHQGVRVVRNPSNVGYARAMNQALGGADAPVLIALNPDAEPGPGTLAALVGRLESDPSIGLVAPRLLNEDGTEQHSVYRFPSPALAAAVCFAPTRWQRGGLGRRWWLEGFSDHRVSTDIDWAIGAVHVIRAAALDGGPPYSERWFMYVEDLELCWRLAGSGWRRRLEGDIAVPHIGNVAGAQQWGDRRMARWLEATYDWYRLDRGRAQMEGWAILNVVGLVWSVGRQGLAVWSRDGGRRNAARSHVRFAIGVLPQHLRILIVGPRTA
jgi:N-acetylglucosaminyl-diphospho-decaprenol L-rhamnosyltransferase